MLARLSKNGLKCAVISTFSGEASAAKKESRRLQCESIIDNCIRLRHAPTKAELPELTERLRDALIDEEQITAETFRSSKAEILLEEGQAVSFAR